MVEHPAFPEVVLAGDVDACLLIQPPGRQSQGVRDSPGLFQTIPCGRNLASTSRVTREAS
jgi:hypothetical protein